MKGLLSTTEIGSSTLTIPISFIPVDMELQEAVLTIAGDMDAGALEIPLSGQASVAYRHARAMERRLPTGSAWHHESMRAVLRGLGMEMERVEADLRDRADIANMLFGLNLDKWLTYLGLQNTGTTEEKEQAIVRKLSDIGGLTAADLTRELQAAGFPLTVYPNRYKVTADSLCVGSAAAMVSPWVQVSTQNRYFSKDLRDLQNMIPLFMVGREESRVGVARVGPARNTGAELIANSLDYSATSPDEDLWAVLDDDKRRWHYGFIVSGSTIYDIKQIPAERHEELRRLIMEIKPLGMWAFLICDFE